jgi:hypothetical protein
MSRILEFYRGQRPTDEGYSFEEILSWPDDRLEQVHTFIQWLFPLQEQSGANPSAPVLDSAAIAAFHDDTSLRQRLQLAFSRMLRFYGFTLTPPDSALAVARTADFSSRARVWLSRGNHNHLRITRILKCLTILGLRAEANEFLLALESVARQFPGRVNDLSLGYWRSAVQPEVLRAH